MTWPDARVTRTVKRRLFQTETLPNGYSPEMIVLVFLLIGVGVLVGSIVSGLVVDRMGSTTPIAACLLAGAACLTAFGLSGLSASVGAVCLFLWAGSTFALAAPAQARLMRIDPANASLLLALYNSTLYIGAAFGAALGGQVVRYLPPVNLLYIASALLILALVAFSASTYSLPPARR
jgi:predicted MFS family arabinose efflux permease